MFIMIDGIDGSGKSTILAAWAEYLEKPVYVPQSGGTAPGKRVFYLKEYWKKYGKHPEPAELAEYDVIISAEPTTIGMGAKIRSEMILPGADYTPLQIAKAYAEDRRALYEQILIPLIQHKKIILQDRGISTSLCYQPLQSPILTEEKILSLPGNQLAMNHAPDHLVLVDASADTALKRLSGRAEKQDSAIFERREFMEKARARFLDPAYQHYFKNNGVTVHILSADANIDIMNQAAISLIKRFIH